MIYKDTLKLYDELLAGGCTEVQARTQANQLGGMGEFLDDVRKDFDEQMGGLKKDLQWMRLIGAAMIVTFLGNIVMMKL